VCRARHACRPTRKTWPKHVLPTPAEESPFGYCDPANRSAAYCLRVLGAAHTGLAPYDGCEAAQFLLHREHWNNWRSLPRRERQRRVLKAN